MLKAFVISVKKGRDRERERLGFCSLSLSKWVLFVVCFAPFAAFVKMSGWQKGGEDEERKKENQKQ